MRHQPTQSQSDARTDKQHAFEQHAFEIDHTQLSLLLSGIDLASVKRRKRYRIA